MAEFTLTQLEEKLTTARTNEILFEDGAYKITALTNITISEQQMFINRVIENSLENGLHPSPFLADIAFLINFMHMFTDCPMPTKDIDGTAVIDSERAYAIAESLKLRDKIMSLPTALQMMSYIQKQIDFENAKLIAYYGQDSANKDAIESFAYAMDRLGGVLNTLASQIEINGNKISKNITPKNIHKLINGLQKILSGIN